MYELSYNRNRGDGIYILIVREKKNKKLLSNSIKKKAWYNVSHDVIHSTYSFTACCCCTLRLPGRTTLPAKHSKAKHEQPHFGRIIFILLEMKSKSLALLWYHLFIRTLLFFLSTGGWVKIKLKLPHFHVSDTYMSCFDLTHAPVATAARAAATGLVSMSTRPDPEWYQLYGRSYWLALTTAVILIPGTMLFVPYKQHSRQQPTAVVLLLPIY